MKKLLLIGCIMLFLFCGGKKATVKTEGLEEVAVFGEEEAINISEEPVLPTPVEEEPPPVVVEETGVPPVPEEIIMPPAIEEEPVIMPPLIVEETPAPVIPPPVIEEAYVPPSITPTPTPPLSPAPTKVYGFRIQIFASSTEGSASRVADDARTAFDQNIYVEYVAPYYKVRVGDCLTRQEAEVLRKKALKSGYRGSFVVETMITP